MAVSISGISSLEMTFSYGVETTAGTKPASFTRLERINQIGGISINPNTIDSSALDDKKDRSITGRASTGGTFDVTINLTDETVTQIEAMMTAYSELTGGKRMWFQTSSPYLTKSFFVVAQPQDSIPQPDASQNSLLTITLTLTIEEYIGLDTKVSLT